MTNLTENPVYETGIYQIETVDPVIGGPPGFNMGIPVTGWSNAQAQQLANRTANLKDRVEVLEQFDNDLANGSDPSKGAALVGRAAQVVNSVTDLRALDKTSASAFARTTGYYLPGDGGHATYYYDSSDTTSLDDGGSVIVATDAGRWKLLISGAVNAKQFGASPSLADNATRLQALLGSSVVDAMYLPGGVYASSQALTRTRPITITGDGIGVSRLKFAGTDGLVITSSTFSAVTHVSGVSLHQTGGSALGTAIRVDFSGQISGGVIQNRTSPRLKIEDVGIQGNTSVAVDGWAKGVWCTNVLHATLDGVHFSGKHGATQSIVQSGDAFAFDGSGSPVEILVTNCWAFFAQRAAVATDCEGFFVDHCNFVAVDRGVVFNPAGSEPQLSVTNSHVNANLKVIEAFNLNQGNISGNLFYARNTATANVAGVSLTNCNFTTISDNVFVNTSSFNYDAVVVLSGGSGNFLHGNVFQSATTAIWLQAASAGVRVGENVFVSVTTRILNQGSGNTHPQYGCTVYRTSTFSLPNNTLTALPFTDVLDGSSELFSVGLPTRLTVAATGYYRVTAGVVFTTSATGYRRIAIRKNGTPPVGFPAIATGAADGGINSTLSLASREVRLVAGDYIELHVAQNSGAAMTLPVAETYLSLQWVNELSTV